MNMERAKEIGENLAILVANVNDIKEEELTEMIASADYDIVLGPMLDPTAFQSGARFDQAHKTKKVLEALLSFKKEVKGIGNFR